MIEYAFESYLACFRAYPVAIPYTSTFEGGGKAIFGSIPKSEKTSARIDLQYFYDTTKIKPGCQFRVQVV
jgi:hypothetical protein